MPSSGQQARLSRPKLTINTRPPPRPVAHDACAQSAPAGTRQEKGIAPMYQAGDRHCAKLAEMMDSPTWRSQNLAPYMGLHQVQQSSLSPSDQSDEAMQFQKEYAASLLKTTGLSTQNSHNVRPTSEVVHLGRSGHEIEVLGIQPFLEASETSSNIFIISAAVSQGVLHSHQTSRDDDDGNDDDDSDDHQGSLHNLLASERSSGELRRMWQGLEQKLENNSKNAMDRDDAIQSINDSLRFPNHQRRVTPDEQQRFRGLIDRLHQRPGRQEEVIKPNQAASSIDPAIIAFLPKKTAPSTPTKRRNRNRSDSGYTSSSGYSRPSTRAQMRMGREASGSADSVAIRIEHQNIGSHDSGFEESPPKNSLLNPTAKEFSVSNFSEASPVKKPNPIRSPASRRVFVPSQQSQGPLGTLSASQTYPTIQTSQGPWYPLQSNISNPSMTLASLQHGVLSGILPPWTEIPGAGIPPMAMPPFSGHVPGLGHPPGFGLPGLTTSSGLEHVNTSGPFHQQLPSLGTCCNPSHQTMTAFSPPALHGIIPQPLAPQTPGPSAPLAGLTPPAVPFIPKHVPKPKVPNTTGQQNWELMHELRRMNEPGYAQRCKEKQKKRYMKQLEKTGGQP